MKHLEGFNDTHSVKWLMGHFFTKPELLTKSLFGMHTNKNTARKEALDAESVTVIQGILLLKNF